MASPASESKPSDIELPAPEASDSAQVASYLEAAAELWKSGQTKEAIRFIQRGAEAAEEDGNDMRALKLARLGADLSAHVNASAAPAAASNGASAADKPAVTEKSARPHPANHPSVRVSQPPPLPGGSASAAAPTPSPPSVAPSAPSAKVKPKAKDPKDKEKEPTKELEAKDSEKAKDVDPAKDAEKAKDGEAEASAAPAAPTLPTTPPVSGSSNGPSSVRGTPSTPSAPSPSRAPLPAAERASMKPSPGRTGGLAASAPPKPSNPPPTAPLSSVQEMIASGVAERVSVKRSSLDANLLVVRPLSGNGAKPAHGARQAVLIYVDSDAEG